MPHAVPWVWPVSDTEPHAELTDDDRIQQMIARVQLDVVRARHHLYNDARKVVAAASENKQEATRQKVTDMFLLHGASDLASQKRGDLANMTATLAALHGDRKMRPCCSCSSASVQIQKSFKEKPPEKVFKEMLGSGG